MSPPVHPEPVNIAEGCSTFAERMAGLPVLPESELSQDDLRLLRRIQREWGWRHRRTPRSAKTCERA